MSNYCNNLKVRTMKVSELASYSSLKSNDLILTVQKNGSNLYSRKTTFSDFVKSITSLTASLSGNVKGQFTGNLIGNVTGNLTGSVTGNFDGTLVNNNVYGTIKGVPFKYLNGHSISFDGTSSYTVTSSYSSNTDFSKKSLNSDYSKRSGYSFFKYSSTNKSSSYSNTSSLSISSSFSKKSYVSLNTYNSDDCEYTLDGKYSDSSEHSNLSNNNLSSSYSLIADFAKTSSFTPNSKSSSYTDVSNYTFDSPKSNLGFVYVSGSTSVIITGGNTSGTWKKVILSNQFQKPCGPADDGKLPYDIKYVTVFIRTTTTQNGNTAWVAWSPDPNDSTQPKILLSQHNTRENEGDLERITLSNDAILPVKPGLMPGDSPSFYYKCPSTTTFTMYLEAYLPLLPRVCDY